MYLNNKLPKGLENLYKEHSSFNTSPKKTEEAQQPQPEIQNNEQLKGSQNNNNSNNGIQEVPAQTTTNLENVNQLHKRVMYQDKFEIPVKYSSLANSNRMFKNNPYVKITETNNNSDDYNELSKTDQKESGIIQNHASNPMDNGPFFEFVEPTVRTFEGLHPGLHDSFIYMIIGPPKSGKTNLLNKIILGDFFYGTQNNRTQFDKIVFISPSILPGFKLREGYNYATKLDLFMLYNMLSSMDEEYQKSESFQKNEVKGHLLLVFDDCIGEMTGVAKKREFENLFNNRRELLVSLDIQIIATSESSNGLPAFVRKISTGIFIFQVLGVEEYKIIMDENIPKRYKEPFKSILNEYLKEKYSYIFISKYPFEIYTNINNKLQQIQMF